MKLKERNELIVIKGIQVKPAMIFKGLNRKRLVRRKFKANPNLTDAVFF